MKCKRWTINEVEKLYTMLQSGYSPAEISSELGRTEKSIRIKIDRLNLSLLDYKATGNEAAVVCPFFVSVSSDKRNIKCEGITESSWLSMTFRNSKEWKEHLNLFCNKDYRNCLLAKMLQSKYESPPK